MEQNFGVKELYDVKLRANIAMKIGETEYEENEPIIRFDKIQIAPLTEQKSRFYAVGGKGNEQLITWENTTGISFQLSEGIISKKGLSILSNSQLIENNNSEYFCPFTEEIELDNEGKCALKYAPVADLFAYIEGIKIKPLSVQDNILNFGEQYAYKKTQVYYSFTYILHNTQILIGDRLSNNTLSLDGKMRTKDDIDGHIKTAIIEMPKVRLMSNLNMRLGSEANMQLYTFTIMGLPYGNKGNKYVSKITILDNEIDSDF